MKKQGTNKNVRTTLLVYFVLIFVAATAFMLSFAISTDYCKKRSRRKIASSYFIYTKSVYCI